MAINFGLFGRAGTRSGGSPTDLDILRNALSRSSAEIQFNVDQLNQHTAIISNPPAGDVSVEDRADQVRYHAAQSAQLVGDSWSAMRFMEKLMGQLIAKTGAESGVVEQANRVWLGNGEIKDSLIAAQAKFEIAIGNDTGDKTVNSCVATLLQREAERAADTALVR